MPTQNSTEVYICIRKQCMPRLRHVDSRKQGLNTNEPSIRELERSVRRTKEFLCEPKANAMRDTVVIGYFEFEACQIVNQGYFHIDRNGGNDVWRCAHRQR